ERTKNMEWWLFLYLCHRPASAGGRSDLLPQIKAPATCFAVPAGVGLSLTVVGIEMMLWGELKGIIMGSCRPPWRVDYNRGSSFSSLTVPGILTKAATIKLRYQRIEAVPKAQVKK